MQYVVTREIEREGKKPLKIGKRVSYKLYRRLPDRDKPSALAVGPAIFVDAYKSFAFANWIKERAVIWDESGNSTALGLSKGPETTLLYLKDIGITTGEIISAMTSPFGLYNDFLKLAGEFGKIIIE